MTCHECGREIHRALTKITENTIVSQADQNVLGGAGSSVKNWLKKKKLAKDRDKGS